MAQFVLKRDGSKEAFDEQKLRRSIEASVREGGIAADQAAGAINQAAGVALQLAAGKPEIASSELRAAILAELDKAAPQAAAAWRKHDAERGRAA